MTDTMPRRLKGPSHADTRSAVLDLIRASGTISRVELSHRSALSEMTISKIVRSLLSEGIIVEVGRGRSTGGKRPVLLGLNSGAHYAIGIALDTASAPIVLCSLDGSLIDKITIPGFLTEEPPGAIERIAQGIEDMMGRRDLRSSSVVGVGVALSGQRRGPLGWGGTVELGHKWERFDVGEELMSRCSIPVIVENDANCAALGTFWSGSTESVSDFLAVYMANGIGAGIVVGGSLFRGASNNAGEIGHIVVDPDGLECWCGSRGCLETVGTPGGIVRRVRSDAELAERFDVDRVEDSEAYARVLAAYEGGDRHAAGLIERSSQAVAEVLLGLANALDLERIQLTGPGFAEIGHVYAARISGLIDRAAFARRVHPVRVELGPTIPEVAALGAASAVLHGSLTPHHSLP